MLALLQRESQTLARMTTFSVNDIIVNTWRFPKADEMILSGKMPSTESSNPTFTGPADRNTLYSLWVLSVVKCALSDNDLAMFLSGGGVFTISHLHGTHYYGNVFALRAINWSRLQGVARSLQAFGRTISAG